MANFNITLSEIAALFSNLFPTGFTTTTKPSADDVTAWIATADDIATLKYESVAGVPITTNTTALGLGKEYARKWVEKQVMWAVYRGNKPLDVDAALKPYVDALKEYGAMIDTLGGQLASTSDGSKPAQVLGSMGTSEPLFSDRDLGRGSEAWNWGRKF